MTEPEQPRDPNAPEAFDAAADDVEEIDEPDEGGSPKSIGRAPPPLPPTQKSPVGVGSAGPESKKRSTGTTVIYGVVLVAMLAAAVIGGLKFGDLLGGKPEVREIVVSASATTAASAPSAASAPAIGAAAAPSASAAAPAFELSPVEIH